MNKIERFRSKFDIEVPPVAISIRGDAEVLVGAKFAISGVVIGYDVLSSGKSFEQAVSAFAKIEEPSLFEQIPQPAVLYDKAINGHGMDPFVTLGFTIGAALMLKGGLSWIDALKRVRRY